MHNMRVSLNREGSRKYVKSSYPVRYGRYSEIDYGNFRFLFNLNGEAKHIFGTGPEWPHPAEWLKRTIGNDWVYYSTGSYYSGVFDLFGEYYLPCPAYPTNSLFREDPFARPGVASALQRLDELWSHGHAISQRTVQGKQQDIEKFLTSVATNTKEHLRQRGDRLHRILKAKVSVLPPDCRHVDYDVIPVMLTEGCLYNCSFCEVKSGMDLVCRTRDEIREQLQALQQLLGQDLLNFNSIYLGQHDALAADSDVILYTAEQAYEIFSIGRSYMLEPRLFLFGSPDSFLQKEKTFWTKLNRLPFYTYVNIGLESFDAATLEILKKPVDAAEMLKAFSHMLAINRSFPHIEITANFVMGEDLPAGHIPALVKHAGEALRQTIGKGCIYISPLKGSRNRKEMLDTFRGIKHKSRLETLLYLIQRL
jgi:hypothetical protein